MLRLKLPTDPYWANLAERNLEEIMTDHAYCEQKAASSAISTIVRFPEFSDLVDVMSDIAQEEMEHFQRVHQKILDRGWTLGKERRDEYVKKLSAFFKGHKDRRVQLVDKLLLSAMIEARSCERFHVLSKNVGDKELAEFYHELELSEANHYKVFLKFARKYGKEVMDVDKKWEEFLEYEAQVIKDYSKGKLIHG